jgi:hypothetical protein
VHIPQQRHVSLHVVVRPLRGLLLRRDLGGIHVRNQFLPFRFQRALEQEWGRRRWQGKKAEQAAVYANRRRIRGERGKRLLRQRGEMLERSFAHLYETERMRRVHLRRHPNILKRLLVHAAALNLGLVMRQLLGRGTPRGLQGYQAAVILTFLRLGAVLGAYPEARKAPTGSLDPPRSLPAPLNCTWPAATKKTLSTTGC